MELFNNQVSVLNVLFSHETPVNANIIASMINSSLKTVKKEIDDLNVICLENGCEIISYPGSGYVMEIYDRERYNSFARMVKSQSNRNLFYQDSQDERVHFIIRCFLAKKNISIYELMDWCNCSESSIRRDIKKVRDILKNHKLSLVNHTNKGTSLEGDEWHIRLTMLHENYYYIFKNKVYFEERETDWERLFLSTDSKLETLQNVIETVIHKHGFVLSYDALKRFTVMAALSITRKSYASLLVTSRKLTDVNIEEEKALIRDIHDGFPYWRNSELSSRDEMYLSIFLKSVRLVRFHIFTQMPEKDMIQKIVDGFFLQFRRLFDLEGRDINVLYKDLCVGTYNLYYSALLDNHVIAANVHQQMVDGLLILDMCYAYYKYLKMETDINCLPYDVSYFYYMFLNFTSRQQGINRKKILVVADGGFFYSRTIANVLNRKNTNYFIEYVPMEYINLKNIDVREYGGIVSDILGLEKQYPDLPLFSLSFFRSQKAIDRMGLAFAISEKEFRRVFTRSDVYYTDKIHCEEDIRTFVKENIPLSSEEKEELFLQKAFDKNSIYGGTRNNNCYLINSVLDYLDKSFIKIICLKEAILVDGKIVNKIVMYNVKGRSIMARSNMSGRVGALIHSHDTYISFDRDRDYELLADIMYAL
ncbi:MAG: HTH domain-containing protein [Erysipelotrichaceae bacterium]|nr:HTH domain-containing protein [Erysipelotrichaceae bacterium]